jgi:hypothetical protein
MKLSGMNAAMLVLASVGAGLLAAFVLRYLCPAEKLRIARNRIYAHLMEFRLFFDEPALVWNAQIQLLRANARLLFLLLPALAIVTPAMWWIFTEIEPLFAYRDPGPGEPVVLTAQLRPGAPLSVPAAIAESRGITVETPVLRLAADRQLAWRLRFEEATQGPLRLSVGGRTFEKSIDARTASFPAGEVEKIEIHYPRTHDLSWIFWFATLSSGAAVTFLKQLPRKPLY